MNDTPPIESPTLRWLIPLVLFVGTLLLIGATSKDYGLTWDEPPYFHASDLHMRWITGSVQNMRRGDLRDSLDDQTIKAAWLPPPEGPEPVIPRPCGTLPTALPYSPKPWAKTKDAAKIWAVVIDTIINLLFITNSSF
jgi:hypothetical protein